MEVVVCAMAKNEHRYINEWAEHYINLGVDKIYIYDNDDIDKPYIGNFISSKFLNKCVIKNIRGQQRPKLQHDIYTGFYIKYGKTFDWCLFCDIDEFLFGITDFHSWLMQPQFQNAKQIRVKWKLFGDDNLVQRDLNKKVVDSFHIEVTKTLNRNLIDKGNLEKQGKMLVRGGLENVIIRSPHFASINTRDNIIPSILPSGKPSFSKVVIEEDYSNENVYLHHYMTKTLSEFVEQKLKRTDAVFGNTIALDYFWRINEKTEEKVVYLKNMGLEI